MIWLFLAFAAAIIGCAFWKWSGLGRDALPPVAAVMAFALAGYMWQGTPGLGGRPASPSGPEIGVTEALIETRDQFQQVKFSAENNWIVISDGLMRTGRFDQAVGAIRSGLRKYPNNADLWTAMGVALLRQSNGRIYPPAAYAFAKARFVSPEHPGPDFFAGIGRIKEGDLEGARNYWAALVKSAPPDASWKKGLEERISLLDQAIAAQPATQKSDSN